jgi:hypothetical protein
MNGMTQPTSRGPLALVIQPSGTTTAERLPANPAAAVAQLNQIIGGHYEAISGQNAAHVVWIAYVLEDDRDAPAGYGPNPKADAIARQLGWQPVPGDYVKGVAVFFGRNGVDEADCPSAVLALAGLAV